MTARLRRPRMRLVAQGFEQAFGNDGNDVFNGSGAQVNLSLHCADGADHLTRGNANDTLSGDNGNDTLNAGGGDDFVSGGAGDDFIDGSEGNDTLNGSAGDDTLLGRDGDNLIQDSDSDDRMEGGDGDDIFQINSGADSASYEVVLGGEGNDTLELAGNQSDWTSEYASYQATVQVSTILAGPDAGMPIYGIVTYFLGQ